jgi:uncharacterized RDD family membrane protein YckC
MGRIVLDEPNQVRSELNYAGFWIRLAAYAIDCIALSFIYYIVVTTVSAIAESLSGHQSREILIMNNPLSAIGMIVGDFMFFVITIAYHCGSESSSYQATPGKHAVGIKVGKSDGSRMSFANGLGRYFGKLLSHMIFLIGLMIVGFDKKKRGLHDRIANTLVFYE